MGSDQFRVHFLHFQFSDQLLYIEQHYHFRTQVVLSVSRACQVFSWKQPSLYLRFSHLCWMRSEGNGTTLHQPDYNPKWMKKFTYLGAIRLYELAEALVECSQKELRHMDLGVGPKEY